MEKKFYDYHVHTVFSDDSDASPESMIEAGISAGLGGMAITDHYDPCYPDPEWPFDLDFAAYTDQIPSLQSKYSSRIDISLGMELGLQTLPEAMDLCRQAVKKADFDFIIGSMHCACGEPLYEGHFFDDKSPVNVYRQFYEYTYNCVKEFTDFDVMGHLTIVDRYAPEIPPESTYSDYVDEILRLLVERGKGIELNNSSYKYKMNAPLPREFVLKRYLELGGEILTTGSDAHSPQWVGCEFAGTYEWLKSLGFRYICKFKKHKPEFIKL